MYAIYTEDDSGVRKAWTESIKGIVIAMPVFVNEADAQILVDNISKWWNGTDRLIICEVSHEIIRKSQP